MTADSRNYVVYTQESAPAFTHDSGTSFARCFTFARFSAQAGDAVSVYTQVKTKDALRTSPSCRKKTSTNLDPNTENKKTTELEQEDDPTVPLERNFYGLLVAGLEEGWEAVFGWECPYKTFIVNRNYSCRCLKMMDVKIHKMPKMSIWETEHHPLIM